jgi:hypothetical protein
MNGQPQVYLADGRPRCRFLEDGEYCFEPAVYVVVIAGCVLCPRYGFAECPGHRACIEHGALLRGEELAWNFGDGDPDHDRDVSAARISAVYREAS